MPELEDNIVVKKETDQYEFTLEFEKDDSECYIVFHRKEKELSFDPEVLEAALIEAKIQPQYIKKSRLKIFCDFLHRGENPGRMLLAKGTPMETGRNGWLELLVSTKTDLANYDTDDHGNIDYRSRHAIANVKIGQVVGQIHPPGEGTAGENLFGQIVPAQAGTPLEFVAAEGIHREKDGTAVADAPGRLIYDGKALSVTNEYSIPSDVNFGSGHVEFLGFVDIKGDVLDGFNVKASQGMEIAGVVGECHLEAGGDIKLSSMFGKDKGTIKCTGNLTANILVGVNVECHGNVIVNNEIRDSEIKTLGRISVENGSIVGGKCIAMLGVEAKKIGGKGGTTTEIFTGISFFDEETLRRMDRKLNEYDEHIAETEKSLTALEAHLETTEVESVRTRIKVLTKGLNKLRLEQEILEEELRFYRIKDPIKPNPKVNVLKTVFDGVILNVGGVEKKYTSEFDGPCTIIRDPFGEGLKAVRLSQLKDPVESIVEKLIQEEIKKSK